MDFMRLVLQRLDHSESW